MDNNKLIKMLRYLEYVESSSLATCVDIQKSVASKKGKVLESMWTSTWKNKYDELDLSRRDTWSTRYGCGDECIDLTFRADDKGFIVCKAEIMVYLSAYSTYPTPNFTATIKLPKIFIRKIGEIILQSFESMLFDKLREHKANQDEIWMEKLGRSILL